jgi:CBS-domain-containing membrane protein
MGSDALHDMGWYFLVPTTLGSSAMVAIAFLVNNLSRRPLRKFPANGWW